jgi:hypothetical protein
LRSETTEALVEQTTANARRCFGARLDTAL